MPFAYHMLREMLARCNKHPAFRLAPGLFTTSWYRAVEPWAQKSHAAEPGSARAYRAAGTQHGSQHAQMPCCKVMRGQFGMKSHAGRTTQAGHTGVWQDPLNSPDWRTVHPGGAAAATSQTSFECTSEGFALTRHAMWPCVCVCMRVCVCQGARYGRTRRRLDS